ncbi:MAG: MASE1 domain-containing protein [Burkholderiaceae bacterium]|nr:MASE1 domain-containing protein [Burkholderiaceae bacterium]
MAGLAPAPSRPADSGLGDASAAVAAGFVVLYLLLDWASFVQPMRGTSITPWNPQAALAVALLARQPRRWWLVAATLVLAAAMRGWPSPPLAELLAAAALSAAYGALALAVRHWLGALPVITTRRDFIVFLLLVAAGCALAALMFVGPLIALGGAPADRWATALLRSWVGDAVGLIVMLPVLIALCSAARRFETRAMLATLEWWLIAALALLAAWSVFGRAPQDQFKFFYLLFLPVAWAAARFGFVGAAWSAALVQLLLILAVQSSSHAPPTVFDLQMLMCALGAMGLLLGTTVDEREQSERALRASLHLAAAGDMAAALAHELNQPLTALRSYARSLQLLAERAAPSAPADGPRLDQVAGNLVHEANRAGEVVRRLKDFFRHRATELQPADLGELLREVVESQRPRAEAAGVRIDASVEPGLPPAWVDRVQIEVVIRNLVANAVDAAAGGARAARVTLRLTPAGKAALLEVDDSGRGIAPEDLPGLFESRPSSKPGGMGIGLFISRAIVESHDGRLWAEAGAAGRFRLLLPLNPPGDD